MPRKRLLGLAVAALALAGLACLAAYRFMPSAAAHSAAPQLFPVVAAASPLAVGTQLQASDLKLLRLPPDALPQHIFASTPQLAGRVLTVAAVPNQVIVSEMVAAPGSGAGLPPLIPAGMRAVSVKVNDVVSVAGFATPGTHVDVLLTGSPSDNSDPAHATTITLLENVQVLTAGQQLEQRPGGKPERVPVITLLVDPAGAEKLAMADGFGHLQLALRNPFDLQKPNTPPLVNASLFDYGRSSRRPAPYRRAGTHAAPPPPPAAWSVEVISGDKKQTLKFSGANKSDRADPPPASSEPQGATWPNPSTALPKLGGKP